ncbi:stage IV sporulation protein A [Thermovenabulum sp.]|uniref:stage IV sporulation protein A n=1 Tax=Thermovenabulum sp. TaxID=3100335 RepID=UPI003C7D4B1C
MENFDLFRDIAERTKGDIYIGVVGPVRAGKSTFVKKFMELLVLPNIDDPNAKLRAKDELPQSGAGRTITTAEPKFIPSQAVEITIKNNIKLRVRLVDNVGFTVRGALGYEDENGPRMVSTPWYEKEIPFQEAAEIGTRKVIEEHSTIGIVVTTDGSITDIPRDNYVQAEERVIKEMKNIGKPFVVVLNSAKPEDELTKELREILEEKYDVPVLLYDCQNLRQEDIYEILEKTLYEFPVMEINIKMPRWVDALEKEHWLKKNIEETLRENVKNIYRLRDVEKVLESFKTCDLIENVRVKELNPGTGKADIEISTPDRLFYKVLSEISGVEVTNDHSLIKTLKEFSKAKKEYDKVAKALEDVKRVGYGIVPPQLDELTLEEPEIIRQGFRFGVRLRAVAPSIHMIRADIQTEVSPLIGTEKQSEELLNYLMSEFERSPEKIWQTNIFGKSLQELVREGIQNKLQHMPEAAQVKLQETLQRIVNEGSGSIICIIL